MPVDPSIALDVGQGSANPLAGQANTLNSLGTFIGLQNQINQNKQFQQTFQARQALGQIVSQAPSFEAGLEAAQKDPQVAGFAGEALGQLRNTYQTIVNTEGTLAKNSRDAFDALVGGSLIAANDPSQLANVIQERIKTLPAGLQSTVGQMAKPYITSLFQGLNTSDNSPATQIANQGIYRKNLTAMLFSAGVKPEVLESYFGKPFTSDSGNAINFGTVTPSWLPGGGAPQITGQIGKNLPPQVVQTTNEAGQPVYFSAGGAGGNAVNPLVVAPDGASPPGGNALGGGGPSAGSPAVPSAPAAGGPSPAPGTPLTGQSQQGAVLNRAVPEQFMNNFTNLGNSVATGLTFTKSLEEAEKALSGMKPGGGASFYSKLGEIAQAVGLSKDVVDKISNGSLGSTQEAQKLLVNTVMAQIQQQLPKGDRLTEGEFNTFRQNNPSIDTDPEAIKKIFSFWKNIQNYNEEELKYATQYLQDARAGKGPGLEAFQQNWINQARGQKLLPSLGGESSGASSPGPAPGPKDSSAAGTGTAAPPGPSQEDVSRARDAYSARPDLRPKLDLWFKAHGLTPPGG